MTKSLACYEAHGAHGALQSFNTLNTSNTYKATAEILDYFSAIYTVLQSIGYFWTSWFGSLVPKDLFGKHPRANDCHCRCTPDAFRGCTRYLDGEEGESMIWPNSARTTPPCSVPWSTRIPRYSPIAAAPRFLRGTQEQYRGKTDRDSLALIHAPLSVLLSPSAFERRILKADQNVPD